jgi:serine/threonine-protein kinase
VDSRVGTTVGKYTITRLIGVGGMGRVYEGKHESLGKRFALKFIDRENVSEESFARFEREAKAASSVESPHIVDVVDVGTTADGLPYIVMELLRGEDLGQMLRRSGQLEIEATLRIVAQVLRGLVRAHAVGIVHRDLKPDNVFLVDRDDEEWFVKILDFGVSKIPKEHASVRTLTREGVVLGTLVYMSPEQAQALPDVDERSDLWAIGAILYECLAGRPAFTGATYESVIVSICTQDPPDLAVYRSHVPAGLASIVKRALSRDRNDRFSTAKEMLDALVVESGGVLPVSLKSDSMRRPRSQSGSSSSSSSPRLSPRPATLGAFSTVAVGKPPSELTPAPRSRALMVVAGAALALGGLLLGLWLSKSGPRPDVEVVASSPAAQVATVTSSAAALPVPPSTPSGPKVEAVGSADPAPSSSTVALATAAPSAPSAPAPLKSAKPPVVVAARSGAPAAPTAAPTATPVTTGGLGGGLQLKKQ